MNEISLQEETTTDPIPSLFDHIGISKVTPSDSFSLTYSDGFLEASVKRQSGKTETAIMHVNGNGFIQMTSFDPKKMNKSDRNEVIKGLYENGEKQKKLEKKFGLSQAMISKIVNS